MNTKIPTTLPRFLWHYAYRYKFGLCCLAFVALYWAINLCLTPYAMKLMINAVADTANTPELFLSAIAFPAILYVFLGFAISLVYRIYEWGMIRTFPAMKGEIVQDMFDYVEHHSYSYFQHNFAGSLANKINDMAKSSAFIMSELIQSFLARTLAIIAATVTLYLINPYFALILILWGVIFITSSFILARRTQQYAKAFSEAVSSVVGKIVDSLSNTLCVKLFANEKFEWLHLKKHVDIAVNKDKQTHWYLLKVRLFYGFLISLLVGAMTSLLIYERTKGNVSIGDFALILTIISWVIDEFFTFSNQLVNFSQEVGSCVQALSLITAQHELPDNPNAITLKAFKGEITFDHVHFSYKQGHPIFINQSVTIHAGEKVGLVGFSGSGKSTFVNLILRFFNVDSGSILIDGQDIKTVTQYSLRSHIAMIPQDPTLFHRSLMDNIRYGRLDATDEEVVACAQMAYCDEFIDKLPDGYESLVGERGVKLSGGQRQRIAIARAMLKNAPILIMDEATSSLDSITENFIQKGMLKAMEGRTTIVIAHRLSTLFQMDRLLVFDQGKIIEDGSHNELLAKGGHYAKLWSMQAGGFLSLNL